MRATRLLRRWVAPFVAIGLAVARPAAADDVYEEQDDSSVADELFHKAGDAYDAGDFALARSLYGQAFEKKKTHDIAAMIAQTELKLGRPCEADAYLAWAIANFPPSLNDERRGRVLRARAEVKKQIGTMRVDSVPADVDVKIDFQPVPASALPGPFCVPAGERVVFVSHDGFAVERRLVNVEPGAAVTITTELRRLAVPAASAALSAGPRASKLEPPLEASQRPPTRSMGVATPLAFAGLFAGLGVMMVGTVLIPLALDRKSEADQLSSQIAKQGGICPSRKGGDRELGSDLVSRQCGQLWSLRDDAAGLGNAGVDSLLVGAVLGAAAGGFLLFRPPASGARPGGPRVTIGAAPDGAFIALKGAF